MTELVTTTEQTLQPGQALVFEDIIVSSGCGECCNRRRRLNSFVRLRANGIYYIAFDANVTNTAAGPVQLGIAAGGAPLTETVSISTPAAVGDVNHISNATLYPNGCCGSETITLVNTGTTPIVVSAGATIKVIRKS